MRYAIAISVVVHVALVIFVETKPEPPGVVRTPLPVAAAPAAAPAPEPEPMIVALLPDDTVATSTPRPATTSQGRTRRVAAVSAEHTGSADHIASTETSHTEVAPTTATPSHGIQIGPPTHSYWMGMRTPTDNLISSLTEGAMHGGDAGAGGPQWGHPPSGEEMDAAREADLAAIDARNNAELKPDGTGMKSDHKAFSVKVAADGTVSIKDKPNWQWQNPLSATFDVTDAMMRKHGMDPYSSYKRKILDETREQRYEMGKQYKTQQLAMSGRFMEKNIERLLASVQDPSALKRGLFELWDDCAESGNEELIAGGKSARDQLLGFIRRRFPQDSTDAFTTAELAQLNQHRTSHAVFEPYL